MLHALQLLAYSLLTPSLALSHFISQRQGPSALRPVTIHQIITAEQAHPDAEFYLDGVEVKDVSGAHSDASSKRRWSRLREGWRVPPKALVEVLTS